MAGNDEKKQPELFGPYEVYERIGVGGMATVHRAKKQGIEGFERVVALKRMLSHLADDDTFIKSFVREARLASQLQHNNIIQIYDLGRVDRVYYIAMEYVRGHDLRKLLKQTAYATGPMPLAMMLTLIRELCDALDYAHNLVDDTGEPLGLVHRDVSPSNILIAADGHLKIIDFGIAKATSSSLRTLSGRVKGKFAYMAPEAIQGKKLDRRTDIFAMGIVAHEMLSARPLFASKNQFDTIRKITQGQVKPPSHDNPECPPELDEIVMTALAKSPDERWQSAGAMHRALDHIAKKHGFQATNREIAEWIEWAFEQPLQSKRVQPSQKPAKEEPEPPAATTQRTKPIKQPTLRSSAPVVPVNKDDSASIELVWGVRGSSRGSQRSGGPNPATPTGDGSQVGATTDRETSAGQRRSGGIEAVPQRLGGDHSGSGPGRNGADGSQPYASVQAWREESKPASMPTQPQPDPRQQRPAGQPTMLGVAPPPGQTWNVPKLSPHDLAGGSGSNPTARTRQRTRPAPPAKRDQPMRAATFIVLILLLCASAAVGGYFAVMAITGP
ncbi:serine/threonine protein kinase [Haliangium sp.]|uniref:serine/threonine protein kinase n=1 Tax=Haliangium sp. TaxID=2663208 RepID=UPI003D1520B3